MKKFISVQDAGDVQQLLKLALEVKQNPFGYKTYGEHKTLGLLFFNPSLRTRLSTQKAAMNLGMNVMVMNFSHDGWALEMSDGTVMDQGTQEHIKEAAGVISQYCDILGIRTFAKLQDREEDYREEVINKFIQNASVPVVSLETATLHPLQSFADLITIETRRQVQRPKVVLSWAPHPRALPQAVANSFAEWMVNAPVDLFITNPEGFDLAPEFTPTARIVHDQEEALQGADFVYTKNWSSYQNYGNIGKGLNDWMITNKKMALTNNGKFMHCLPVRRNVVVADEVLDGPDSLVLEQAANRTVAAQTVLLQMLGYEK